MQDIRPVPSHAISLWFEGDRLCFALPPSPGEPSHHISIPIERCGIEANDFGTALPSQRGWEALLSVLRERYHTATQGREARRIGNKTAPIQYMIDQILRAKITVVGKKRQAKDDLKLEDLDL